MSNDVRFLHGWKASMPMVLTLLPSFSVFKNSHLVKAQSPTVFTESGIVNEFNALHSPNDELPKNVKVEPLTKDNKYKIKKVKKLTKK